MVFQEAWKLVKFVISYTHYKTHFLNKSSWLIESITHAPVNELSLICSSQLSNAPCRLVCVEGLFKYADWSMDINLWNFK